MSLLIGIALLGSLWIAFRQVERTLVQAGADRTRAAADQLSDLLAQSGRQRFADTERAASNPIVLQYLRRLAASLEDAVRECLRPLTAAGQPPVELWDTHGVRLLAVDGPPGPGAAIAPP